MEVERVSKYPGLRKKIPIPVIKGSKDNKLPTYFA
jgi:hypothetical protein